MSARPFIARAAPLLAPHVPDPVQLGTLLAALDEAHRGANDEASTERFYSAERPGPYRTARAFLDAHRRGEFPTRRIGGRLVALVADVHAAIERKPPVAPRARPRREALDPLDRSTRRAA